MPRFSLFGRSADFMRHPWQIRMRSTPRFERWPRRDASCSSRSESAHGPGWRCNRVPPLPVQQRPDWLSRIETLSTTIIVVMIGGMMLWYEAVEREARLTIVIASAVLLYVGGLVSFGRSSNPNGIAWWPFALAGLIAGSVAEFINAQLLVTSELSLAGLTGVVIGTAHWTALRVWLHLTEGRAG